MELLKHQIEHSDIMAAGDDIPNFSEAGTGKTVTTMEAFKKAGFNTGLVIAPSIALPMWKEELENYLGCSAHILKTGKSPLRGDADFHITSYGLASNLDLRTRLKTLGGDALILDEAHYIKTRTSARTKAVLGPNCTGRAGLYGSYEQCWMLTGTPIMRHADDLWSQLRATHPDVLREHGVQEYDDFVKKFCFTQIKKFHPRAQPQRVVVGSRNEKILNQMLYDEIGAVRATLDDVEKEMPPLTYRNVYVAIRRSPELAAMMKGLNVDTIEDLLEANSDVMAKAWRLLGELKLDMAHDYIREESDREPILVGYWHTDTGAALAERLRLDGKTVAIVKGGMSMDQKEAVRKAFNNGAVDVLVGQISAMNVSWNLQEHGRHVVILEDHFSPGLIEQFVKRIWRFGQEQHVQVDFIKAEHDLDTAITRVRSRKEVSANKSVA